MKVIIVRHAQTTENAKTKDIGHDNEALLTNEGVQQAMRLGEKLKAEKINYAYVSPQKRAVHTAQEVLKHHPEAKMVYVEHLKEQRLGVAELMPKSVWKEIKKKSTEPWHLFKAEKGESYSEMQARATEFFNGLIDNHKADDTILIVSHGGTLGVLLLHILEKELNEENYLAYQPKNTEFTIIKLSDSGHKKKIHKLNSAEHLES